MTTTDQLAAIEARATAATEGPWDAARGANANGTTYATTYAEKTEFLAVSLNNNKSPLWLVASDEVIPAATGDGPRARANAEFIAHARCVGAAALHSGTVRNFLLNLRYDMWRLWWGNRAGNGLVRRMHERFGARPPGSGLHGRSAVGVGRQDGRR